MGLVDLTGLGKGLIEADQFPAYHVILKGYFDFARDSQPAGSPPLPSSPSTKRQAKGLFYARFSRRNIHNAKRKSQNINGTIAIRWMRPM
jgi:hypothetical protein